ncbi:MAG TPA: trehalose-phosphatase [Terriglobales bacterium]|nr:trehalose-phosphatase [Terriglobales bacterium]
MATATTTSQTRNFLHEVHRARSRVLLLDYDGTIAPFAIDRDRAVPYPQVVSLLRQIVNDCDTRVALISGRPARQVALLSGLNPHPEIWGSHGLEHLRTSGEYQVEGIESSAAKILNEAAAWLEHEGLGNCTEHKHGAVAVHWRGLAQREAEEARTCAYRVFSALTGLSELSLCEFDGGLELQARRGSKAHAVRTVLSEIGDDVPVAYLGDDLTDEYAFRALAGRGLTILVRPTYRFTAAQVWLCPPQDLTQFLNDWIRACGGSQ